MDINNLWSGYDINSKKQNTRCLAVNTILEGKYLVGPVLGQGGFGITYVGYDLNMEAKIAIKEYFPVELVSRDTTTMHGDRVLSLSGEKSVTYKQGLKKYVAEAQNVSQFSEIPGVVSVKDFFYANETAYIVMEYIDGISLKDYLKEKGGCLTEEETLAIMKPVLEALVQVHKSGIIHRDISPDNIMLTFEGSRHGKIKSVKLIDFGAARMTAKNDQKSLTIILKHGYAPEEQYRTHGEQGPWTDVYALSAVLYRMLTGETPVPAMDRMFQDELKTFDKFNTKVSANTAAAILKGLAVKKEDRIQNVQELIGALYEGAKVKASAGAGKSGKNKVGLYAGIGAAALIACVAGISGLVKKDDQALSSETASGIVQDTIIADHEPQSQGKKEESSLIETVAILDQEEESDLGETIAYWNPQTSICGGEENHVLICKQDGTVQAMGSNGFGQCRVEDWTDIVAVSSSERHSLGLRRDGKVFAAGDNRDGQCDVGSWENIVQVAAGRDTSYGLTADGRVLGVGDNYNGVMEAISEWTDIKAITTGYVDVIIGLDKDGNLHYAGNEEEWTEVSGWQDVNHMIFANPCVMGIKEDGTCVLAELQECDWTMPNWSEFSDIQQISGFSTCIGVTKAGNVMVDNAFPYSGYEEKVEELEKWNDMEAVINASSSDRSYIVGLKRDGSIVKYEQAYGNSSPEEMRGLEWIDTMEVSGYTNLIGKTKDGKFLTYGLEYFRMEEYAGMSDLGAVNIADVEDIVGIDTVLLNDGQLFYCGHFSDGYNNAPIAENAKQALDIGPMIAGLFAVLTDDGTIDLKTIVDNNNLTSDYLAWIESAEEWTDVVQITGTDYVLFGLHGDGSVSTTKGSVEGEGYIKIQCNEYVTGTEQELVGIRKDGTADVIIATENSEAYGRTQIETWEGLVDICLGESHVAGLREDGTVVAAGSNHSGQCDVEEWHNIVYLKTGKNCTLGITEEGGLLIAGSLF